jgi:hypothetical protein
MGRLRGARSLRDLYTLTRRYDCMGPRVARHVDSDQREDRKDDPAESGIRVTSDRLARSEPVRQDPVLSA